MNVDLYDQIVDMDSVAVLAQSENGMWEAHGNLFYPSSLEFHSGLLFYRRHHRQGYDYVCSNKLQLESYLGKEIILYQAYRPVQRSNKAFLMAALSESYMLLSYGKYETLRTAIIQLSYYSVSDLDENNDIE